ncbi:hypothetical protein H310_02425 [Aphanomyces invadans]|uniref:Myb/SANT-like domain-containing protein n=1 Tax=Aphanomyces invadans TaxID=157072 RepID=A0A024UR19_9STRA|nr:hypothetical protein H310_02425 [Aphanomyces invadans]ETW08058.1 hypothetical protein H310_02425 [Aphanomyces invadans]|eukprot:XP_008864151.1 hypothetical protein H310_02425 [Aphanomyces invadans]
MEKTATTSPTAASPAPSSPKASPVTPSAIPVDVAPQPKRRGRPPKVRDPDETEQEVKRPRGRPRNSDKPTASWCAESVKLLFYLRYDSDLRQKFDEKDNRAKRTGYEMLASTLSDKMGRKFDNAQVQQKLSQLNMVWSKLDPKDDSNRPQHWEVMNEYWGPDGKFPQHQLPATVPKRDSTDSDTTPAVSAVLSSSFLEAVVPPVHVPHNKLRRILSKQAESEDSSAASFDVHSSVAVPSSAAAHSHENSIGDHSALVTGFMAVKDGLVAISTAIAGHIKEDKMDMLIGAVAKQTRAIEEQSKQLASLVTLLSAQPGVSLAVEPASPDH